MEHPRIIYCVSINLKPFQSLSDDGFDAGVRIGFQYFRYNLIDIGLRESKIHERNRGFIYMLIG